MWSIIFLLYMLATAFVNSYGINESDYFENGVMLGVSREYYTDMDQYLSQLGIEPVCYVAWYENFPLSPNDKNNLTSLASYAAKKNGCLIATILPNSGLNVVTNETANELAVFLAQNEAYGVHIILRWAHEMNGPWNAYGLLPTEYKQKFALIASAIRNNTCNVRMMWNPNDSDGYPFVGNMTVSNFSNPGDFSALDTNNDGVVNGYDDAYGPFYPGDEYVDWVALSIYHWGIAYPWFENALPQPYKFSGEVNGSYISEYNIGTVVNRNFYQTYAVEHDKPMAIGETGALYNVDCYDTGPSELDIKKNWWMQVFDMDGMDSHIALSVSQHFPKIRLINWFDQLKNEPSTVNNSLIDWRISYNATIRNEFVQYLSYFQDILYLSDFQTFMKSQNSQCGVNASYLVRH